MALMIPTRRLVGPAVLAILALPLLAAPFTTFQRISLRENRVLATAPAWPKNQKDVTILPRKVDAYVADHFAFREALIAASAKLDALSGSALVPKGGPEEGVLAVTGAEGQMFLVEGLLQSTGQTINVRHAKSYSEWVCGLKSRVAARGGMLFASLAPSPAEIVPEVAPSFALPAKHPTDYDRVLLGLRACGVATVDLRPPLIAAKRRGRIYRRIDSHWTELGALVAYNAVMEAVGRRDWASPERWAKWTTTQGPGDLARMAGRPDEQEVLQAMVLPPLPATTRRTEIKGLKTPSGGQAIPPFIIETGRPGPRILVIGDSYSTGPFFTPHLARVAGATAWIHMDNCGFDERVFDMVKPDYVLLLPAERMAVCG